MLVLWVLWRAKEESTSVQLGLRGIEKQKALEPV